MGRRHDADAGGDSRLLEAKAALREKIWETLREAGVSRFPGAHGRIPNFVGAEQAAQRLRGTDPWRRAESVKSNPDSPQWPVRQRALEDGKRVYMAVPRLAEEPPFMLLDPDLLEESPRRSSSIKGASRSAQRVTVEEMGAVDLVVVGCVAVGVDGARLGKGGGFADLEFAVAHEAGIIDERTVVATTVHDLQVREAGEIPLGSHDVTVDLVVTPDRVVVCDGSAGRPTRVMWEVLTEEKIGAIPLLARLRGGQGPP